MKKVSTIGFIGLGIIGGSIARGIKRCCPQTTIMAYMRTRSRLEQARADGTIDLILDGIDGQLSQCDLIFLCTPVEYNVQYLSLISPYLKHDAILTDVGSTKAKIHQQVKSLGLEHHFVGGHPMAGSEKTGYEHSSDHLLENAYYIITPTQHTTQEQLDRITHVAKSLGSIPMILDCQEHDEVVAAVSHLPHLIASSLVNLVKDSDNPREIMKQVAAGGFKDITRIASASPKMWEQICMTNRGPIADYLERYIDSLQQILNQVRQGNSQSIHQLFDQSRTYRNSITDQVKGPITPDYSFTVDIVDEPGSISTLSVILAAKGISIQNIGMNHNREYGGYVLRISFHDEAAMKAAWDQLSKYKYELA